MVKLKLMVKIIEIIACACFALASNMYPQYLRF